MIISALAGKQSRGGDARYRGKWEGGYTLKCGQENTNLRRGKGAR